MGALTPEGASERLLVRLFVAGHMQVTSAWNRHRGSCFPSWVFYCNDAPGASVRVRGQLWPLEPGSITLIPPWTTYDCVTTAEGIGHLWAVYDLIGLPVGLVRSELRNLVRLPLDRTLRAACASMARTLTHDPVHTPDATFAAKAAIYAALGPWWRQLPAGVTDTIGVAWQGTQQMAGALRLIDERLASPLPIPALARATGLSPAHFCRRFQRLLGQSPAAYVRDRRIAAAAALLATSDAPIPVIAATCGFSDRYAFTRIFTHRLGTPPGAYRRLQLRRPSATP